MWRGRKIVILGAGNVGATIAYTLTLEQMAAEICLIDINTDKAKGEALDITQATAFCPPVSVYQGEYEDARNADIVIVTLGLARKPGQTRIDLAQANADIVCSVIPQIVRYAPNAIYLIVSNPVDILTYVIQTCTGLPESQVFGTGTMLDTARLRVSIADKAGVSSQSVNAYVLGEHGDTAVIPWSLAYINGIPAEDFPVLGGADGAGLHRIDKQAIASDVYTSGARVIGYKGATFYAIAMSVLQICTHLLSQTQTIATVSSRIRGQYGIEDVCLSLPFAINSHGIQSPIDLPLTTLEQEQLRASAGSLKQVLSSLTFAVH